MFIVEKIKKMDRVVIFRAMDFGKVEKKYYLCTELGLTDKPLF